MHYRLKTFSQPIQPIHFFLVLCSLVPILSVILLMCSYRQNIPANDEWGFSLPIAIGTRDGTLSVSDLFVVRAGHRGIFTAIQVALLTKLTDWNVESQIYITLALALVIAAILASLAWNKDRQIFFWFIVPAAALVFSLRQGYNWLWGVHTAIFFVVAFFLAALWVIVRLPMRWRTLITAAGLALCSTYSLGHGVMAWPALFLAIGVRGYRQKRYLAFWIVVTIVALGTFMWGTDIAIGESKAPHQAIQLSHPFETLQFALAYIAGPMIFNSVTIAQYVAVAGLTLFGANLVYLWFRDEDKSSLATWVGMAGYGAGTGFLVALTRRDMGMPRALSSFYVTHSNLFWIALIALICKTFSQISKSTNRQHVLMLANLLFAVMMVFSYFYTSYRTAWNMVKAYGYYPVDLTPPDPTEGEGCMRDYLLTGDASCSGAGLGEANNGLIDYLAAWNLSIFADQEPSLLLSASYRPGSPVIVETPWPWMNKYIQDMYLDGVGRETIFHITTPTDRPAPILPGNTTSNLTFPEVSLNTHDLSVSYPEIQTFTNTSDQFWYVGVKDNNLFPTEAASILENYILINRTDLGRVEINQYARIPENVGDLYLFDSSIALRNWTLVGDIHVQPCQTVVVQTWWSVTELPQEADYVMTLVLSDSATGQGVTQNDGVHSSTQLADWEPERLYADERQLTIPCDAQSGEYPLLVGLYTVNDANQIKNLPVTLSDGTPNGNYGYLTTLFVGES